MIKSIVNIFKNQARQHKTIKAFMYGRNYEQGSGKDRHPLFWLEDPMTGQNQNNTFVNTINFSILFVPLAEDKIEDLQNLAFSTGLNIIERIKADNRQPINILPDWTYLTLTDYYDDSACGCRFTVNFTQRNMQNLCLIEEQFDINKAFEEKQGLNEFKVSPTNSCEIFTSKLPDFNLKTRK